MSDGQQATSMGGDRPDWERRFRAPEIGFPRWARNAPGRLAVATNESGSWQVYAWDLTAGTRRRVTDIAIGVDRGFVMPDGERIAWFDDASGDENGRWVAEPFGGGPAEPLVPGVPDAWSEGIAASDDGTIAVGTGAPDGFSVYVSEGGRQARRIHHHAEMVGVAALSRDGRLLALEHAEHGDSIHFALRVVDPRSGETVGEQWDGDGLGLHAADFSPVPGDARLAIEHERAGLSRPGVWNLETGERSDIELDLPGDVFVRGWWPDGSALLVGQEHEGRNRLYRLDLPAGELHPVDHPAGTVEQAGVRPDGSVWYRHASGAEASTVRTDQGGAEVIASEGERAPAGRPFESWSFTNPSGDRIHGFVVTPPGDGPFPVVMDVHGGPTWAYADDFRPTAQAWVDHGVAVAMVNYRGSTGYGRDFRDALIGRPGFPELEDVAAGMDDLVAKGVADPARTFIAGNSWGGYITLLSLGREPGRYALGLAGVPVADYAAAYEDESEPLKAYDRTLFGGSPDDLPDLYLERSPLTYIENVKAPVLILAGDNDSRCPIRQIVNYCERLTELGKEFELYRFSAGHGSMVVDELVAQMRARLEFALPRVGLENAT